MGDSSYAPRSPDLSALRSNSTSNPYHSAASPQTPYNQHSSSYSAQTYPSYTNTQFLVPPQQASFVPGYAYTPQQQQEQRSSYDVNNPFQQQQQQVHQMSVKHEEIPAWSLPPQQHLQPLLPNPNTNNNTYASSPQAPPPINLPHTTSNTSNISQPQSTRKPRNSASAASGKNMPKRERIAAPGEAEGVVVKTKFPVARIKRIVQADEDVGKVAQVTPVVVSKALELFMISLTLASATQARQKSAKRITAQHLRAAVLASEQFDFLSEIVAKIPEAPSSGSGKGEEKAGKGSGKGKRANEEEEEEDSEEWSGGNGGGGNGGGGAAVKASAKKRRGRRARAKSEDD